LNLIPSTAPSKNTKRMSIDIGAAPAKPCCDATR
jgi:hypothetical protein